MEKQKVMPEYIEKTKILPNNEKDRRRLLLEQGLELSLRLLGLTKVLMVYDENLKSHESTGFYGVEIPRRGLKVKSVRKLKEFQSDGLTDLHSLELAIRWIAMREEVFHEPKVLAVIRKTKRFLVDAAY